MLYCQIKKHYLYATATEGSTGFIDASEEFAIEMKTNQE